MQCFTLVPSFVSLLTADLYDSCITLVPSHPICFPDDVIVDDVGGQEVSNVSLLCPLLYHSALLLSAGWSLVLSTNHWSLPQWLRQNFCCWNITKCNKWYNSNVHPNPYKRNKAYLASQCSQFDVSKKLNDICETRRPLWEESRVGNPPNTLWYH